MGTVSHDKHPVRVLHVINTLEPGGAETLLVRLCRHLPEQGVIPYVASLLGRGSLAPALEAHGVPVIDVSRGGRPDPLAVWKLICAIRRHRIEIVHTHLVQAGIAGKLAAMCTRVPVVTTRHYAENPKHSTLVYRLEDWLTRRRAARVIAVGEAVHRKLLADGIAGAERIVLHRNAVDLDAFTQKHGVDRVASGPVVIGTVGRMHPAKAHEVLLEAMAIVHRERPHTVGVLVGDGERRAELEEVRRRLGLDEVVRFVGAVAPEEIPGWLARFDIFVLSSDWEGLPVALVEAAASGLPIVATAVGGVPEVVRDGTTGLLVPPRQPRALAEAIIRLIDTPAERRRLGENAGAHARKLFDIRRLAHQTAALYQEILAERGSGARSVGNAI